MRRVRPSPGTQLALFSEFTYHPFITDREGDRDTAFMLQLELKGLASVGSSVESLLQDGILGYQ